MAVEEHFSKELLEYQDTKIQTSEMLKQHYRLAVGLLRAGVGETLPISEVFDAEQLGRFLGVTHFGGAWHALKWHTLRYYFNEHRYYHRREDNDVIIRVKAQISPLTA